MKKSWKDWAIAHIKATGKCPGDFPSFGSPNDQVTEEEFKQSIASLGTHKYTDCHFVDELMGFRKQEGMKEITAANDDKLQMIAHTSTGVAGKMIEQNKMLVAKKYLHQLVDKIAFRSKGVLYVPKELLNIEEYLGRKLG